MGKEFVLGLDIGTSSGKVCILDIEGRFLGIDGEAYPTRVLRPAWAEQDPGLWLPALGRACRRLIGRLGLTGADARGLAITSAAHVGVLLDAGRMPVRPSLLWHDQRSQPQSHRLAETAGDEIFALGNNWPTATWTLPHLLWIRENDPEAWEKSRYLLLSKDYLAYQLTGRMTSDPAAAVSALLWDAERNAWSPRLCELAGLTSDSLSEVLPIGAEIGALLPEAADILGLTTAVRVFNGTMDSTAETFSAGVRAEGECVIRLASAGGIHGISHPPRVHPKLISYPYPVAPYWLAQAGTNTCASAVAWACSTLGDGEPDFAAWTRLAESSSAGAGGLLFHPYLAGERCPYWDSDLRASFVGLSLHHGRADIARAVYEGTAYALRDGLGVLEDRGFALRQVRLVGGGTKSALWCQIVSAVLDCPVQAAPQADSSAGGCLFALAGLGRYGSLAEIPADLLTGESAPRLGPDPTLRDVYRDGFAEYRRIQRHLAAIYHGESA